MERTELTLNRDDWSGHDISITADVFTEEQTVRWDQFGCTFWLEWEPYPDEKISRVMGSKGFFKLRGSEWPADHVLYEVHEIDDPLQAVRRAVPWICNHI